MSTPHNLFPSPKCATPTEKTKVLQARLMEIRRDEPSLSWQATADKLGMSRGYTMKLYKKALKDIIQAPTEEVIKLELERLDDLYTECVRVLKSFHLVVNQGQIIRDVVEDENGKPIVDMESGKLITKRVEDMMPKLAAIDRALKIQDRRAKLLGLDKVIEKDPNKEGMTAEEFAVKVLGAVKKIDEMSGGLFGDQFQPPQASTDGE